MREEGILTAVAFEREGEEFYRDAAAKASNPLAIRVFAALAVEEVEHRLRLENKLQELREGARWPGDPGRESSLEQVVKDYFFGLDRERLREEPRGSDNVAALDVAMETERRGLVMYDDLLAGSADDEERDLLRSLKEEEVEHLKALENVHAYLTRTADWFQQDESRVWNWMNS